MILLRGSLGALVLLMAANTFATETTPSFADFNKRAKAGERLNVVFFGASLTWGANASDPNNTSYRAQLARRMEELYPEARFKFFDSAIGGTGSQLGVFRFDRDVLRHKPHLVFLDFSANDDIGSADPETLASYESLVRRIVVDAKVPCVQVLFPFMWNIQAGKLDSFKRRDAHLAIAAAYNCPAGDAIALGQQRVKSGETTLEKLWPYDGVHPGDAGYTLFTDAAWNAFKSGVDNGTVCKAPDAMLHAPTYMKNARIKISSLTPLPEGWRASGPNPVAAFHDMLMTRWLDDESIASNRKSEVGADGKKQSVPQTVAPLKARFSGSMVFLFGEATTKSGKYRVTIDGQPVARQLGWGKTAPEFDPGDFSKKLNGNAHHAQVLATGLDPAKEHTLVIEPLFDANAENELRLESICVAGGEAWVRKE